MAVIRGETVILLLGLYGYGIWCLTERVEYELKMFGKRVLEKVLARKRGEIKGGQRKLQNETFKIFIFCNDQIKA